MQIAIFGGSFDPVHIAHLQIVNKALVQLDIDKIIVVPTYLNPLKRSFKFNPQTRLELLKKVFEDNSKIEVSDYEVNKTTPSYSIETIKYLKDKYKATKIYFIIGADNILSLDKWYKIDEIKALVNFVVASRDNIDLKNYKNIQILNIDINISSSKLRNKLDLDFIPKKIRKDLLILNKKGKKVNRLEKIRTLLDDKKAVDIEVIDLTSKEYIVDYVVIATTLNNKHGFALLTHLKEELKPLGEEFLRVEENDDWTICDLGDIFIHLMSESHREKYSLEEFLSELEAKA